MPYGRDEIKNSNINKVAQDDHTCKSIKIVEYIQNIEGNL